MSTFSRRVALVLFWPGLLAIIAGLIFAATGTGLLPGPVIGGGIVAIALSVLIHGDLVLGRSPRLFTARGQVVRGHFQARSGWSSMAVGDCPNDRIAMLRSSGRPFFESKDGVASLRLKQRVIPPSIAQWQTGLAGNVLWTVDVHSSTGDMVLNLTDLRLDRIVASTGAGRMTVACPRRGVVDMALYTGIGEVEIRIPPEVGVHIKVPRTGLVTVKVENDRLQPYGISEYVTPEFESAPAQISIAVQSRAGDVILT
ncbi:MAG: hypothetical protein GYB64_18855 [Chloroflexi bacterium]|nr:hypothetical protein [Chloroflexota bacterium]